MPRNFTLGELVTRCKQRADMENSDLISDAEWKGLISTAFAALHGLIALPGMRYYESQTEILGSAFVDNDDQTADVPLPEDHLSTVGVDYKRDGDWYALPEMMAQERNIGEQSFFGDNFFWALVGCSLRITPKPKDSQEFRHIYIPQPVSLSSAVDTFVVDVVTPEGEEYVVWHVVVNALSKEQSDIRNALGARAAMKEAVERWVINRSLNTPRRPQVDMDSYGYAGRRWGGEYY